MALYTIETDIGQLHINDLSKQDIQDINVITQDLINRKEFECNKKALIAGFICWLNILIETENTIRRPSDGIH
jgi:hypothetical protein